MKKLLVLTLAFSLLFGIGNAFAFGSATANTNPKTSGSSGDSASMTSVFGFGDDTAWAGGGSNGSSENQGDAALYGWGKAKVSGEANFNGETHALALATDLLPTILNGQPTSFSIAGIETSVTVDASGKSKAYGLGLAVAENASMGTVQGQVDQNTYAAEITGGTSASAGQSSGAIFNGAAYDSDKMVFPFIACATSGIDMTGSAAAGGESFATIDNKGSFQSATAQTANFATANVVGDDRERNQVYGSGGVGIDVVVSKSSSAGYAGGTSGFSYNSTVPMQANGQGSAQITGYVDAGNHTISAHAAGSAQSSNF